MTRPAASALARCESCRRAVAYPLAPCPRPRCRAAAAAIHAAFGRLPSADEAATFDELAAIVRREDR